MQVGDRVFYPMHGAGVISGVESCEVLGENKEYFVLKMPMGNLKVMIPQDNVENLGLREIISRDQVEDIRTVLKDKPEHDWSSHSSSAFIYALIAAQESTEAQQVNVQFKTFVPKEFRKKKDDDWF